jgi:hypothetical protein
MSSDVCPPPVARADIEHTLVLTSRPPLSITPITPTGIDISDFIGQTKTVV